MGLCLHAESGGIGDFQNGRFFEIPLAPVHIGNIVRAFCLEKSGAWLLASITGHL